MVTNMPTLLTKHFSREELACPHCDKMLIPQDFIERLERLRVRTGIPMTISSGYRCSVYNQQVSGTGSNGPHTLAAVDVAVRGKDAFRITQAALVEGFTGIGVSQKGDDRFIHLDALPGGSNGIVRPMIWSY